MHVVVVESPAKARTLREYLGAGHRIIATRGHVCDLAAKDGSVDPARGFATQRYATCEDSRTTGRPTRRREPGSRQTDASCACPCPTRERCSTGKQAWDWHMPGMRVRGWTGVATRVNAKSRSDEAVADQAPPLAFSPKPLTVHPIRS